MTREPRGIIIINEFSDNTLNISLLRVNAQIFLLSVKRKFMGIVLYKRILEFQDQDEAELCFQRLVAKVSVL